jgi:F0F1-type ATP synthase membrane subunit a
MILAGDLMILAHYFPFIILFILTVLEIAVAMIQSYIFTILTYMYLSDVFVGH